MHSRRSARALVLGLALATVFTMPVVIRAEIPREPPPGHENTLQAVLDRIHEHAKDEAWRQGGWQDEKIEKWLDKLVGAIAKGADLPDLKLPVRQAELQPADPALPVMRAGFAFDWKGLQTHSQRPQLADSGRRQRGAWHSARQCDHRTGRDQRHGGEKLRDCVRDIYHQFT